MKLELTLDGLLDKLANHYTNRGDHVLIIYQLKALLNALLKKKKVFWRYWFIIIDLSFNTLQPESRNYRIARYEWWWIHEFKDGKLKSKNAYHNKDWIKSMHSNDLILLEHFRSNGHKIQNLRKNK